MASWHGLDVCLGTWGLFRKRCVSSANRNLRLVHNVCQTHRAAAEIRRKRTSAYKHDRLYRRRALRGYRRSDCKLLHMVFNPDCTKHAQANLFAVVDLRQNADGCLHFQGHGGSPQTCQETRKKNVLTQAVLHEVVRELTIIYGIKTFSHCVQQATYDYHSWRPYPKRTQIGAMTSEN